MKITKKNLYKLLRESVISEAASDWDEYLKQTKSGAKVKQTWELVQKNKDKSVSDSDVDIRKFENSYMGWVKWYNTCRKNSEIMNALGKKPGSHISPDEMMIVYASMIPPGDADTSQQDEDEVEDFVTAIFDTGQETDRIKALRKARKENPKAVERVFKSSALGEKVDPTLFKDIESIYKFFEPLQKYKENRRGEEKIKESFLNRRALRRLVERIASEGRK